MFLGLVKWILIACGVILVIVIPFPYDVFLLILIWVSYYEAVKHGW